MRYSLLALLLILAGTGCGPRIVEAVPAMHPASPTAPSSSPVVRSQTLRDAKPQPTPPDSEPMTMPMGAGDGPAMDHGKMNHASPGAPGSAPAAPPSGSSSTEGHAPASGTTPARDVGSHQHGVGPTDKARTTASSPQSNPPVGGHHGHQGTGAEPAAAAPPKATSPAGGHGDHESGQAMPAGQAAPQGEHAPESTSSNKYTCPMHPDVVRDQPGACPTCGMKLQARATEAK